MIGLNVTIWEIWSITIILLIELSKHDHRKGLRSGSVAVLIPVVIKHFLICATFKKVEMCLLYYLTIK